ncbi:MAG: DNA adenine methylase [Clostridiaceae bacterium]|nr:DNA adenine methylase [Clostridiaceae bacterium]
MTKQLITYLGNKRSLLDFIGQGITEVKKRLGRDRISFADIFAGSGIVSRYVKKDAFFILSNDLEGYCETIARCYLANPDTDKLRKHYNLLLEYMKENPVQNGFIRMLYSPEDGTEIKKGERVFYTPQNASYIDTCRAAIDILPPDVRPFFLAPLLSEASVKCNTSGVFKGFYKDRHSGIGSFGGSGKNALSRILAPISLPFPVFSNYSCPYEVTAMDANIIAGQMEHADVAYIDPPYNQHPYGSNYFMLNLINDYKKPTDLSSVSGIPKKWNRSDYNKSVKASDALGDLCQNANTRFLLVSFNSEGFVTRESMMSILSEIGNVTVFDTSYNVFRGSRNLRNRPIHNSEYLYLVDKEGK